MTSSAYWNFGDGVTSTSINKATSPLTYVIGWNGYNGHEYADNSHFYSIGTMSSIGSDLQLANSATKSTLQSFGFNTSASPYNFNISNYIYSQSAQKQESNSIMEGRGGVIALHDAQYRYLLGDIQVDGQRIKFVDIADTLNFPTPESLNKSLITNAFNINDNSSFTYSVQYWVTDSTIASNELGDNGRISFRVKLVDNFTNEVLGIYDPCTFTKESISPLSNVGYQIETNGVGNRMVHLELELNTNIIGKYALVNKVARNSYLSKKRQTSKTISFRGLEVVKDYSLLQNYPNPFNPNTTINYALPKPGMVTLTVYDAIGREVSVLVNTHQESGRYAVNFDASKLSSGMYIYKLTSGSFTQTKKMMLVK